MTNLYLHIGPHKTGSTYLQKQLCAHRVWLRERGWDYPEIGQDFLWGHHSIVEWLRRKNADKLVALSQAIHQQGKDFSLILSSENFEDLDPESIARLKDVLSGFEVSVVYYTRKWPGLLYSAWQESVKHGSSSLFPEFVCSHILRPFQSSLLNYALPLDRYKNAFGSGAIKVVSYDNLTSNGTDIFQHFLMQVLCLPSVPKIQAENINTSLPPQITELIRALNAIHFQRARVRSAAIRDAFLSSARRPPSPQLGALIAKIAEDQHIFRIDQNNFLDLAVVGSFERQFGQNILNASASGSLFDEHSAREIAYCGQDYILDPAARKALEVAYKTALSEQSKQIDSPAT